MWQQARKNLQSLFRVVTRSSLVRFRWGMRVTLVDVVISSPIHTLIQCQSAPSTIVHPLELPPYIDSAISLQVDIPPPAITTSNSPSAAAVPPVNPASISATTGPLSADNVAPGTTPPPPSVS
ncbi:hypothetical protein LWI28_002656 [Acer negundo]|uniref:Uncharacterized protein n=1 Tax=Acer negundo TaxID=4023 RepID=A0AAD5IXG2_ACENE|nr:hypothetical protein LWI28_002656 [Acer negundo]